jgi:hypothetical protein
LARPLKEDLESVDGPSPFVGAPEAALAATAGTLCHRAGMQRQVCVRCNDGVPGARRLKRQVSAHFLTRVYGLANSC